MVLSYGDTPSLTGPWYAAEIRSDNSAEPTIKRLCKEAPGIFHDSPFEAFLPFLPQDLDHRLLSTLNIFFVRSDNFKALLRLKQVQGILGLVTKGDSNRPSDAITVPAEYVQGLITEACAAFERRGEGVGVGSFVRLLEGELRGYCGHVEAISPKYAKVRIKYLDRDIIICTPTKNLKNLDDVPKNRQVFYYSPEVAELEDPSLLIRQQKLESPKFDAGKPPKVYKRSKTVTVTIRRLMAKGDTNPWSCALEAIRAMQTGEARKIASWHVFLQFLRNVFPGRKLNRFGLNELNFSVIAPDLNLPVKHGHRRPIKIKVKQRRGPKSLPKSTSDCCNNCPHKRKAHNPYRKAWNYCTVCACRYFREKPKKVR